MYFKFEICIHNQEEYMIFFILTGLSMLWKVSTFKHIFVFTDEHLLHLRLPKLAFC